MRVLPILSIGLLKKDLASVVFDLKCEGGLVGPELIVGDLCCYVAFYHDACCLLLLLN